MAIVPRGRAFKRLLNHSQTQNLSQASPKIYRKSFVNERKREIENACHCDSRTPRGQITLCTFGIKYDANGLKDDLCRNWVVRSEKQRQQD